MNSSLPRQSGFSVTLQFEHFSFACLIVHLNPHAGHVAHTFSVVRGCSGGLPVITYTAPPTTINVAHKKPKTIPALPAPFFDANPNDIAITDSKNGSRIYPPNAIHPASSPGLIVPLRVARYTDAGIPSASNPHASAVAPAPALAGAA